ncbi:hypothetical protein MMC18_002400 [Xylographa bjoerkii]|nr:hypothetical protein [Xylographa bjoerkii]
MADPNANCVSPSDLEAGMGYTDDSALSEKRLLTRNTEQTSTSGHGSVHNDVIEAHAKGRAYFQFTIFYFRDFVTVESYPLGFPKAAAFLNSDDQFMVYRRFGVLFSRLLLRKQDELVELEERLSDMDDIDNCKEETKQYLRDRDADDRRESKPWNESRTEVLDKIEQKALEYSLLGLQGMLLLRAQELVAMNCPSATDHDSVLSFMENEPAPFNERESAFIHQKEDLVTLRPGRESAWLEVIIEHCLKIFRCRLLKETGRKTSDRNIRYFTRSRISRCATLIITLILLVLLITPVWLLYHLTAMEGPIAASTLSIGGVLLTFTMLFAMVISAFTKAERHEIFAASAG